MVLIVSISPYSLLNRQLSVYKFIIVVHVILCYSFFMYLFVNDFCYFQDLLTYHLNDCMISCIKILLLYPVQLILVEDSHVILSSNVYLHHSLLLVLCRRNEILHEGPQEKSCPQLRQDLVYLCGRHPLWSFHFLGICLESRPLPRGDRYIPWFFGYLHWCRQVY